MSVFSPSLSMELGLRLPMSSGMAIIMPKYTAMARLSAAIPAASKCAEFSPRT